MLGFSQELIWFGVVFYDLLLAIFLFRYYGKYKKNLKTALICEFES